MFDVERYAFQIETTTRAIFKCERYGIGVIAESDFIVQNPLIPMIAVLGNFYNKVDISSKDKIDEFIELYHLEVCKSIEEIGEVKIKEIISKFNNIVKIV